MEYAVKTDLALSPVLRQNCLEIIVRFSRVDIHPDSGDVAPSRNSTPSHDLALLQVIARLVAGGQHVVVEQS